MLTKFYLELSEKMEFASCLQKRRKNNRFGDDFGAPSVASKMTIMLKSIQTKKKAENATKKVNSGNPKKYSTCYCVAQNSY